VSVGCERHLDVVAVAPPGRYVGLCVEREHATQSLPGELVATLTARAGITQPQGSHVDVADHGRNPTLSISGGFVSGLAGNNLNMKIRIAHGLIIAAALAVAGCSSDTRASLGTDIGNAVGQATNATAELLARNIATQQGEEQFKNAGQELAGPLACEAKVQDGVAKIDINCTGTTKAGGAAALTGATSEIPGASVISLNGDFTATVDGAMVFTTQRLGG
jgi:hypothetical protein